MKKSEADEQTKQALHFIEKLNFEISYLIKEIEGLLSQEPEEFQIGRGSGYAITASRSFVLDKPDQWVSTRMGVFFVAKENRQKKGGFTHTPVGKDLRALVLAIQLTDKEETNPKITLATIRSLQRKDHYKNKWPKFEDWISDIIWHQKLIFNDFKPGKPIDFEYSLAKMEGEYITRDLYDINSTEDIQKKLIEPALKQYRKTPK